MQEFVDLVKQMRTYQRQYFEAARKGHSEAARLILPHAKDYEAKVDRALNELKPETPPQPQLF